MAHFLVQRMFRQEQCHIPRHFLYNAFYTSSTDSSCPLVSYRKNEEAEPQWRWCRVEDVSGGESKAQCWVEPHGNLQWEVHEARWAGHGQTGAGKSEQEHFRNQWTKTDGTGQLNYRWPLYQLLWARLLEKKQNSLLLFNKTAWNAVLECNLKNDSMVSKANHSASQ